MKFVLASFFQAKGTGPWKHGVWKGESRPFKAAMEEAGGEIDQMRKLRQEKCHVEAPKTFMEGENKRKREAAASKAREALKAKQEEVSNKRKGFSEGVGRRGDDLGCGTLLAQFGSGG